MLVISKETKNVFKKVYKVKRFTKDFLNFIKNEPLDELYKKCKKAGYKLQIRFVEK